MPCSLSRKSSFDHTKLSRRINSLEHHQTSPNSSTATPATSTTLLPSINTLQPSPWDIPLVFVITPLLIILSEAFRTSTKMIRISLTTSSSHRRGNALCVLQGLQEEGNDRFVYIPSSIPVRCERILHDFSTRDEDCGKTGTDRQLASETLLISRPTVLFRRGKHIWDPGRSGRTGADDFAGGMRPVSRRRPVYTAR